MSMFEFVDVAVSSAVHIGHMGGYFNVAHLFQIVCRIYQRYVRVRLRKIPKLTAVCWIVFLREQSNIVPDR